MYQTFDTRLALLDNARLARFLHGGSKGVEKESLRVTANNRLAQGPHPAALGSTLTHPYITTDFSEAQLELVTPPQSDARAVIEFQHNLHAFIYGHLDDEVMWSTSMPCIVQGELSVPIARFGSSNVGRMKHVYRRGSETRYRRIMQIISGVHFNYSLPAEFWPAFQEIEQRPADEDEVALANGAYLALARNARRYDWLLTYLFGCSPALCKSFMDGDSHPFEHFDSSTLYQPHATSLRLSDIGYKNQSSSLINVSYADLESYVTSLFHATETPYPPFADLGVYVDGEYRQLNANLLQIENEFYGTVRPKQATRGTERPLVALAERGVGWLELRSLDVNAFAPTGVTEEQLRFLEAFLIFCLLMESPPLDIRERAEIAENLTRVVHEGRRPDLTLRLQGAEVKLHSWAGAILERIGEICELLDTEETGAPYAAALEIMRERVYAPDSTPSARMLAEMTGRQETFYQFARRKSDEFRRYFEEAPLSAETEQFLNAVADESHRRHAEIEEKDRGTFEAYLQHYFEQIPGGVQSQQR